MNLPEVFESSTLSLILAWGLSIPIIFGIIAYATYLIIGLIEVELPWLYGTWLLLCIIVCSPLRYLIFQLFLSTSFPVQSFSAFFETFLLILYIPIVFILLCIIGIGLPLLLLYLVFRICDDMGRKFALWSTAILAPLILYLGTIIFMLVLPIAAKSTHRLEAEDVIKASNGPAYYYWRYIGRWGMPVPEPKELEGINNGYRSFYRSQIASLYLSKNEYVYFLGKTFPNDFDEYIKVKEN